MDVLYRIILLILIHSIFVNGQEATEPVVLPEKISKTLDYYESILEKHPELAEARFGAGYAAYNIEDYQRALSEFESALTTEDSDLKSKTFYNLGNTLHQEGRFEESLLAFRKALELNPTDIDAKYNYELTRQIMQQLQSPESQSSSENQENKQSEQEEEQKESSQDQSLDQPRQDRQQREQETQQNEDKRDSQTSQVESEQEDKQKPDAESILNALRADEKNLMKRQLIHTQSKKMEKDW